MNGMGVGLRGKGRGVNKVEREFRPVKSTVACLDGARFSVEIEFRQIGVGQKASKPAAPRIRYRTDCFETGVVRSE
jgi:hypothetical protein